MKKFFAAMLLVIVNIQHVSSMVANINNIKTSLNTAFGQPAANGMYIITVTRTPTARDQQTSLISHDEFEELLKLLYRLCANQLAPPYNNPGAVVMNNDPNCQRATFSPQCLNNVLQLSNHFSAFFVTNNMQNNCKIVVFNEMFFSQESPLSVAQKNFINGMLVALSATTPNSIFFQIFYTPKIKTQTVKTFTAIISR